MLKRIAANTAFTVYDFIIDYTSPTFAEYSQLTDAMKLRIFYGKDAKATFRKLPGMIKPSFHFLSGRELGDLDIYQWRHDEQSDAIVSLVSKVRSTTQM